MPKFLRRDSTRFSKFGKKRKKLLIWRKPKGRDNKMREKRRGYPEIVKVGYGKDKKEKVRKIEIVKSIKDLEKVNKKNKIILGKIGKKNKIEVLNMAKQMKIKFENINLKLINKITTKNEPKK